MFTVTRRVLSCLILLAVAPLATAQHRTFSLDQGQYLLSASPGGLSGARVDREEAFARDYTVEKVTVSAIDGHNGVFSLGESVSLEYGLYDTVAVGVKSRLVQPLRSALAGDSWEWGLAGWVTFDGGRAWGPDSPWGLFWTQGLILDPLATNNTREASGLVTVLSSMLFSWRLVDNEAASLALYTQGGLLVSCPNPVIDAQWRDPAWVRRDLRNSHQGVTSATDIEVAWFRPKLVLEAGVEVRFFQNVGLVVGLSRPFYHPGDLFSLGHPESELGLGTLELRWWF